MTISINGTLSRPAQCRTGLDGRPYVYLLVRVGPGLPIEIVLGAKSHDDAHALVDAAGLGDRVVANAEGIDRVRTDHDVRAAILANIEQAWLRGECVFDSRGLRVPAALR